MKRIERMLNDESTSMYIAPTGALDIYIPKADMKSLKKMNSQELINYLLGEEDE